MNKTQRQVLHIQVATCYQRDAMMLALRMSVCNYSELYQNC